MGDVSDNESFRIHINLDGPAEYYLHHHLGCENQDEEVQITGTQLGILRRAARKGQSHFSTALKRVAPSYFSFSANARSTLRRTILALDSLPGTVG